MTEQCTSLSWTDKLRCVRPARHPGEHTNHLATDVYQVRWIDDPEPSPVVESRHTADTITDDALDALHERLEEAEQERDEARALLDAESRTLAEVDQHRDRIRHAAWLHRQGLLSTAELHAVISPAPGPAATEATQPAEHNGGNAEDCPACADTNPPYPFLCPKAGE